MPIQYFGQAFDPTTDDANSPSGPTVTFTPPSNMLSGDFVLVSLNYRGQVTWTNSNAGGQTWSSSINTQQGILTSARLFWCVFNGTWSANPVFTVTTGTSGAVGWMAVFRGVNNAAPWDVTPVLTGQVASTTFVVATYNTNTKDALAIVGAVSADNNTWTVDNSFTHPSGSGNIYWRSSSGQDTSLVLATKNIASPGAVGQTTMTQATVGADAGVRWYGALRDAPDAYAQANAHIKVIDREFAQAQANIVYTYFMPAQAQAQIPTAVTTSSVHAQANADIQQTYQGFAQANAQIKTTYVGYANANIQIKAQYQVYAQANIWLKVTGNVTFAQAQAHIKEEVKRYAQAQSQINATTYSLAQGQAHITAIIQVFAQAETQILSTLATRESTAQSQTAISVGTDIYQYIDEAIPSNSDYILTDYGPNLITYIAALEDMNEPEYRQDHILRFRTHKLGPDSATLTVELLRGDDLIATRTVNNLGEGINTYSIPLVQNEIDSIPDYANLRVLFSATAGANTRVYVTWFELQTPAGNAKIRRGFAQALATIKLGAFHWEYAQAQGLIKSTYSVSAQAQVLVKQQYQSYAQANTTIRQTYQVYAQAQVSIKTTYNAVAQALATTLQTYAQFSQAQAQIKQTYQVYAQAQATTQQTYQGYAQAEAYVSILGAVGLAQAQAQIRAFGVMNHAQAQAWVGGQSLVFAQAQAKLRAFDVQSYAQSLADIKATSTVYAQSLADIKAVYVASAQAQTTIRSAYQGFAQAGAQVKATTYVHANALSIIRNTYTVVAQSIAQIKVITTQNAQAQTWIKITDIPAIAQAQATIKATSTAYAQAGAQIKNQYLQIAFAQALIQTAVSNTAQANAYIQSTGYGYANTQAAIIAQTTVYAQSQVSIILAEQTVSAQAQAFISKIVATAQAQAFIHQPVFLSNVVVSDVQVFYSELSDIGLPTLTEDTSTKLEVSLSDVQGLWLTLSDQLIILNEISDRGDTNDQA